MVNTRFNRFAQVIEARFSAGVWSSASFGVLTFFPLPRLAGVTRARYLLFGANTPWKRVRLTLGLGTRETNLEIWPSMSISPDCYGRGIRNPQAHVPLPLTATCQLYLVSRIAERNTYIWPRPCAAIRDYRSRGTASGQIAAIQNIENSKNLPAGMLVSGTSY